MNLLTKLTPFFGLMIIAAAAGAAVPNMIAYQGRLTTSGGTAVANGNYNVSFRIYDAAVGGTTLWNSGSVIVTTTDGLFAINLGAAPQTVFPATLFDDTTRYLGITVGGDPELSPRTRLTTVPYAARVASLNGASGGAVSSSIVAVPGDSFGDSTKLFATGAQISTYGFDGLEQIRLWGPSWGEIYLNNSSTSNQRAVELSANGTSGGLLELNNELGNTRVEIRAGTSSTDNGSTLELTNAAGLTVIGFLTDAFTAQGHAVFPDSSINDEELQNEPGIASAISSATITLVESNMIDIETVSITIPTSGYIQLTGKCLVEHSGTGTAYSYIQIDEISGGSPATSYYVLTGSSAGVGGGFEYDPVFTQRTYFKAAGTYTFRLEGQSLEASTATVKAIFPSLVATFYPTAYGTVSTLLPRGEAGEFSEISAVQDEGTDAAAAGSPVVRSGSDLVKVDLRELEMKAKKLERELQQTYLEMARAKKVRASQEQREPER